MNRRRNSKRGLGLSLLCLVLCLTMLVGSTFAWFTDTDTTTVNTIQAGNLDVVLEMYVNGEWVNAENERIPFVAADGREDILWEPGATYKLVPLRVINKGNLDLAFKVVVDKLENVSAHKLNEVIEWTYTYTTDIKDGPEGEPYVISMENITAQQGIGYALEAAQNADQVFGVNYAYLDIEGHMDQNAGNEYQGLEYTDATITLMATQLASEYDSTGNVYDWFATYDEVDTWDGTASNPPAESEGVISIGTAEQLAGFVAAVNNGSTAYQNKTIKLTQNIDLADKEWTPINGWNGVLNGTTIDGNGHSIKNMKISSGDSAGFISNNASSVTIKNLVFDNAYVQTTDGNTKYAGVIMGKNYSPVTIENVSVINSEVRCTWQCGGLVGFAEGNGPVFKNCTVRNTFVGGYNCTAGAFFGLGGVDITVEDSSVSNVQLYTDGQTWNSTQNPGGDAFLVGHIYGKTLTVTNSSVNNVTVVSAYPGA